MGRAAAGTSRQAPGAKACRHHGPERHSVPISGRLRAISQGHERSTAATAGPRSRLLNGFTDRDLSDSQADSPAPTLLTDLLTTAVDAWRQPWTPRSASEPYGPVSWTVMDLPGPAQPPEKRKAKFD